MTKPCLKCGAEMAPKRFPSGKVEGAIGFSRRKYCSLLCAGKGERQVPNPGAEGGGEMTFAEIGRAMGFTSQRAQQIYAEAMNKLKGIRELEELAS